MSKTIVFKDNDEREVEKHVGIEFYSTSNIQGIGGEYKKSHKDFIVKEITTSGKTLEIREDSSSPPYLEEFKDKYTRFNLVKVNKDSFQSIKEVCKALKLPYNSIQYSGIKDKCSISVQQASIRGNYINQLRNLKLHDIYIRKITPSKTPIKIGAHFGNNFTIVIRNIIDRKKLSDDIKKITENLNEYGFPNYFGLQRFGTFRPNSHKVGQFILQNSYQEAYHEFLTTIYSTESSFAQNVRIELRDSGNLEKALKDFPKSLNYERIMIEYLIAHPENYKGAINTLPSGLKSLLISAFQSWLYNKMIALRMKKGISLFKPVEGDVISILAEKMGNVTQIKYIYGGLYDKYLEEAIKLNRAVIVAPLIGYSTKLEDFPFMKTLCDKIFKQEKVDYSIFNNDLFKKLHFKGAYRAISIKPIGLKVIELKDDEFHPKKKKLKIEFSLGRGSYATMLLRELIK